jgi:mono/diheme cytochrome c family protein
MTVWAPAVLIVAAIYLTGCQSSADRAAASPPPGLSPIGNRQSELRPGPKVREIAARNPHEGNEDALADGKRLFDHFNCSGCHAAGGGAIGPALIDDEWIYGSRPGNIFWTIVEGRPQGMPAFGGRISEDQIWRLVTFVRSAAGLKDTETETVPPEESLVARGQAVFMGGPCAMCHAIRGTTALSKVGPDLTHVASRTTLAAGTLPNTRGNLAGWILNPQNLKPGTKMPPTLLKSEDLHALLAYLETLGNPPADATALRPTRGEGLLEWYGCASCHQVRASRAGGRVGPPLTGVGQRSYFAGHLPNTAANLVRWIREPRTVKPGTIMPDMNVSEADAQAIASYLYSLR